MISTTGALVEEIKSTMAIAFDIDIAEIPDSANQATLIYWSSLHHMALVAALEDYFDVHFSSEEILDMTSLADIAMVLRRHQSDHSGR